MTKSCIKILVESDSAIESAFPYYFLRRTTTLNLEPLNPSKSAVLHM